MTLFSYRRLQINSINKMDTIINQTFCDYLPKNNIDKNMTLVSIPNMIIYGPSGSGKYTNLSK